MELIPEFMKLRNSSQKKVRKNSERMKFDKGESDYNETIMKEIDRIHTKNLP